MSYLLCALKFAPAVLVGLLVVAWGASMLFVVATRFYAVTYDLNFSLADGCLQGDGSTNPYVDNYVSYERNRRVRFPEEVLGRFRMQGGKNLYGYYFRFSLPILTLITLLLPLAIGLLRGLSFRLWHCLAYSMFFAVQLGFQSQGKDFPFDLSEMRRIGTFLAALIAACVVLNRIGRRRGSQTGRP